MGPTGSGKSSFIEALVSRAPGGSLGIAKDQLESVTQHVSVYRLHNVRDVEGKRLFIVDTPGLADPKISELRVLSEVKEWRDRWFVLAIIWTQYAFCICIRSRIFVCLQARKSVWRY
ncbi:hypothetical protein BJ165DRAFT_1435730 [Panaeolus papilionaceus]|nr:hypothetical protein BJ165DRAFT_1435730 [Panaeolus papilionaceus]